MRLFGPKFVPLPPRTESQPKHIMYRFSLYREQYRQNLRLALPIVLTQVGQILTQVADNLMVGHYGGDDPTPLAAVSFGGAVFFILFVAAIGMALGLTPLVGGALRPEGPDPLGRPAPERHPLLHAAGTDHGRRAVCRHPADVPPQTTRRGGRNGHSLLPNARLQHAFHDAVLLLQAISRGRRQHEGRNGRDDPGQPGEHRLQLGLHLRTFRSSGDGRRGRRTGHAARACWPPP